MERSDRSIEGTCWNLNSEFVLAVKVLTEPWEFLLRFLFLGAPEATEVLEFAGGFPDMLWAADAQVFDQIGVFGRTQNVSD